MFDLEPAIAEWRQQMLAAGIKTPVPLEELEGHLRDEIIRQMKSGLSEQVAFNSAVQQMGQPALLKKEFAKTGATKWAWLRKFKSLLGMASPSTAALEDFTPTAKQSLALAPEEARRFHPYFIGTEHVLLGLLRDDDGVVCQILQRQGISRDAVRKEIEKIVGSGPEQDIPTPIPYTPRARRAFQLAMGEAKSMNHPGVGSEHLFLGLLREGGGVAAVVLKSLGVDLNAARRETLKASGH